MGSHLLHYTTFHSSLFSNHYVLSFTLILERKNENIKNSNSFPRMGIKPSTVATHSHLCPTRHDGL